MLPSTKVLAAVVIGFLLVAFVVLYLFPADTKHLFAWTIKPTMTPMVLASAYLGGAYFFTRVVTATRWNTIKTGLLSVALFASLLGIATIIHWDRFNHRHVAFWLWAGLYFTTPLLVVGCWLANRRSAAPPRDDEPVLPRASRVIIGATGAGAVCLGVFMFLAPEQAITIWPWALTPLTARVLGAIFCLGSAGIGVFLDPRWTTARLMLQVECVMVALMLIAAVRARGEFDTSKPMTWLLLAGFVGVLASSGYLYSIMDGRRAAPASSTGASGQ